MIKEAIYHICDDPYAFPIGKNQLKIRLKAKKNDISDCYVFHSDRYDLSDEEEKIQLKRVSWDENFDYFEGVIYSITKRIKYKFYLQGNDKSELWYGENGTSENSHKAGVFQFPYISEQDMFNIPEWASNAVVYQILPDRFCNGDRSNDPYNIAPWDEKPTTDSFYGGDLKGIIEKLDYLEDLGINLIYLTPIFTSPSSHKYDTIDYFNVDPHFGDMKQARELVDKAHERGIHVILDATFHHCSEHFFAFKDVMKNGKASPYADWFYIYSFPIVQSPSPNYATFGFLGTMPKLKTHNKEVRDYLINIGSYWIEEIGIDGWRIDVANEIDHEFWRLFRKKIKSIKPEALIIGEIWHNAGAWLRGEQFDGITNYKFREAVHDFFAKGDISVSEFNSLLTKNRMTYSDQANRTMFNLLDSHDTERFLTDCKRLRGMENDECSIELMKLAVFFQMTYIGLPIIYYGDEIGMMGAMDPDCRKPMIWDSKYQNHNILEFYKKLIDIRKNSDALTNGEFRTWIEDSKQGVFGYIRFGNTESMGVLLNNSNKLRVVSTEVKWKDYSSKITDLLSGREYIINEKVSFEIPPFGCLLLV
ncbi:MAG: glycoside hydrolase family 13 protein [Bacillota bacterium]|nr:glycoside hydrolase family 13 protein [Bacillota bacterium]